MSSKRLKLVVVFLLLLGKCMFVVGTEHTIREGEATFDGARVKPGDVINVSAGSYKTLKITNVKGTAVKPVLVKNKGGIVTVSNDDRGYAIALQGCQYLQFTGTGSKKDLYGFRCATKRKGMMAFHVNGKSSDIEVDHVEVFGAGFAGFNVKDEPSEDKSTNRGNFVMYNISLHHNYVHDVNGEGFYIGHTFYDGWKNPKTGNTLMPHLIKGLRVYGNIIHNSGCEAIQIGSASEDVEVFANIAYRTGRSPFAKWQDNGIQIGVPTTGRIYNNLIVDVPGTGIVLWGDGNNQIFNNVIAHCGALGIYVHKVEGKGYTFANNTIVDVKDGGIKVGNPVADVYRVCNNIIITPASPLMIHKSKLEAAGNILAQDMDKLDFLDPKSGDFRLGKKSSARGKAARVKQCDVTADLLNRSRPKMKDDCGAFIYANDVGAFDLSQSLPVGEVLPFSKKQR